VLCDGVAPSVAPHLSKLRREVAVVGSADSPTLQLARPPQPAGVTRSTLLRPRDWCVGRPRGLRIGVACPAPPRSCGLLSSGQLCLERGPPVLASLTLGVVWQCNRRVEAAAVAGLTREGNRHPRGRGRCLGAWSGGSNEQLCSTSSSRPPLCGLGSQLLFSPSKVRRDPPRPRFTPPHPPSDPTPHHERHDLQLGADGTSFYTRLDMSTCSEQWHASQACRCGFL